VEIERSAHRGFERSRIRSATKTTGWEKSQCIGDNGYVGEPGFGLGEKGEIPGNFLLNLAANMRYDRERYSSLAEEFYTHLR
jgi:hypothetical protein